MKLYRELANWWPLMSPHTEYEEEAHLFLKIIMQYHPNLHNAIEFGSGGGSNAFYLKKYFQMTLTDLSPNMLEVSRELNPDCLHMQSEMGIIDAGRDFDLVFIHDVISYFTDKNDLLTVMKNAKKHLNSDGLRYLEWSYDLDTKDQVTEVEYAYLMCGEDD